MICEYSYYPEGNEKKKPCCKNERKLAEDDYFKDRCPLIYYCTINERFEQSTSMFGCKYRGDKNDGQ